MRSKIQCLVLIVFLTYLLSSCEEHKNHMAAQEIKPATLQDIPGTQLHRITLTPEAAKRIGIQMGPITGSTTPGTAGKVVPYSAIIYDPDGITWVYTSPAANTFVREAVTVNSIAGDQVIVSTGPNVGTQVVTTGATELYGTEYLGNIQP